MSEGWFAILGAVVGGFIPLLSEVDHKLYSRKKNAEHLAIHIRE